MNTTSWTTSKRDNCSPVYHLVLSLQKNDDGYEVFIDTFIVLNVLIAISSTLPNFLIIFTIAKTSSLRTSSNILVLGLAVSDLICGISAQPMYCVMRYWELKSLGDVTVICKLQKIFNGMVYLLSPMTLLMLTAITTDRYLAIKLHLRYQQIVTEKRAAGTILTSFFISCLCSVVTTYLGRYIKQGSIALIVLLIAVLMVNAYFIGSVSRVIRRHSRQIHNQFQSNINMPRYKKTVNTIYYVIGAFLLCYVPMLVSFIVLITKNKFTNENVYLKVFATTCLFMNGLINPLIYFRKNRELRIAAVQVLSRMFRGIGGAENTGSRSTIVTLGLQSLHSVLIKDQGSHHFPSFMYNK